MGEERGKNYISHVQLCIYLSDISLIIAFFVKNVIILPHWKSNNLRAVGNTLTISTSYNPTLKHPDCPFKFMYSNVLYIRYTWWVGGDRAVLLTNHTGLKPYRSRYASLQWNWELIVVSVSEKKEDVLNLLLCSSAVCSRVYLQTGDKRQRSAPARCSSRVWKHWRVVSAHFLLPAVCERLSLAFHTHLFEKTSKALQLCLAAS